MKTTKIATSLLIALSLITAMNGDVRTSLAETAPPAQPNALNHYVYVPFASDGRPAPVPRIFSLIDATRAVSKEIGFAGGVLNAVGRDGTQYSFSIPPNSLAQTTTIVMTPVSVTTGLPYTNGMLVAVNFRPDGLLLVKPGTLVMTPTQVISPSLRIPYGFTGIGNHFHRRPMKPNTTGIVFDVQHFSGFGVAVGTRKEADETPPHPNNPGDGEYVAAGKRAELEDPVRAAQEEGQPPDPNAPINFEKLARDHYNNSIVPLMGLIVSSCDSPAAAGAINQILAWMRDLQLAGISGFQAEQKAAGDAIVTSYRNCRQKQIEECLRHPPNPEEVVANMLFYERQLQLLGVNDNVDLNTPIKECRKGPKFHGTITMEYSVKRILTSNYQYPSEHEVIENSRYQSMDFLWQAELHGDGSMTWRDTYKFEESALQILTYPCSKTILKTIQIGSDSKRETRATGLYIAVAGDHYEFREAQQVLIPSQREITADYDSRTTHLDLCYGNPSRQEDYQRTVPVGIRNIYYQKSQISLHKIITGTFDPVFPDEITGSAPVTVDCEAPTSGEQVVLQCFATMKWHFIRDKEAN